MREYVDAGFENTKGENIANTQAGAMVYYNI
jgi:hypothetical protein